jgi:hypothetical protein
VPVKKRDESDRFSAKLSKAARLASETGQRHGAEVADAAVSASRKVWKTKLGKRAVTGGVAGAAIGAALPLISMVAAAGLGAGLFVIWKGLRDKD